MTILAFLALAGLLSLAVEAVPAAAEPKVITADVMLVEGKMEVSQATPNNAKFGPAAGPAELTVKEWTPPPPKVSAKPCVLEFFAGLDNLIGKSIGKVSQPQYCNGGSPKLPSASWANLTRASFDSGTGPAKICADKWGAASFPAMIPYTLFISRSVNGKLLDSFRGAQRSWVRMTVTCLKKA